MRDGETLNIHNAISTNATHGMNWTDILIPSPVNYKKKYSQITSSLTSKKQIQLNNMNY